MDHRLANWIMLFVTLGAVGFAAVVYLNQQSSAHPVVTASVAPSTLPSATTSATPTPQASASPTPTATPTATSSRTFSTKDGVSVPNEIETIKSGGSLFTIAQERELSVNALAKLNGITDPNTVYAGQTVIVPDDITDNSYTILFVTNANRIDREKKKIESGGSTIYTDPVSAAQADTRGIYGLDANVPYSKSNETDTSVTLASSDTDKIVTLTMEKHASGLWTIKKMVIELTKETE